MKLLKPAAAAAAAVLLASCASLAAQPTASAVGRTANETAVAFLEAFNALEANAFDAFFAEDATMFFPSGPFPQERVQGRAAVTAAFHRFFDMARGRGATRLSIQPQDLVVQDYGDFAVASFHLRGNGNIGRRSIVLRRERGHWLIVHFHASSLELPR